MGLPIRNRYGLILLPVLLELTGCAKATSWLKKYTKLDEEDPDYAEVPGEDASNSLAPSESDQSLNVESALKAMALNADEKAELAFGLREDDASIASADEGVQNFFRESQTAKTTFQDANFVRDDASQFSKSLDELGLGPTLSAELMADDTVNWTDARSEFTVSVLSRMPVRDQGGRGTCASFTGIGQIEGAIIKKYDLASIDLSEQRFYYLSKPENWGTGGDPKAGGSNAGTGFGKSFGVNLQKAPYDKDAPDTPKTFNLPLESSCPYNSKLTGTDLQTPQAAGCLNNGVAKVTDFAAWLYKAESQVNTPQQMYDFLLTYDYPVTVATKLSSNWENNDGIITQKDAGEPGDSSHASGHAYLVVGARKLDESKYPGEGGMCFVIRNSWGKGWGVGGLSCMTLAWFNKWRFPNAFPQAIDVEIDPTKYAEAKNAVKTKPTGLNGAADRTVDPPRQGGKKRRGTVSFFTVTGDGLNLSNDDFDYGSVITGKGTVHKAFYLINESTFTLRGILREKNGEADVTHDLVLIYEAPKVFIDDESHGKTEVGVFDADKKELTLCGGIYAEVCIFNYVADSNDMVIGLTRQEFYKEESKGPFSWNSFSLGGYGFETSSPEDARGRMDLRFLNDGNATNPLRMKIDPFGGDIRYAGQSIGNYQNLSFCSGSSKDVCRVILDSKNFGVFFKAKQ